MKAPACRFGLGVIVVIVAMTCLIGTNPSDSQSLSPTPNFTIDLTAFGPIPTSITGGAQFAYLNNAGTRIVAAARDMTPGTVSISFLRVE